MVSLQVPDSFKYSYERFESYPGNLVGQNSYVGSINGYTKRLDSAAPKLFATKEVDVDVPFRDLRPSGLAPERENVDSDDLLRSWLGDNSTVDPLTLTSVGDVATKEDPRCRFIFFWAGPKGHSRSRLAITRKVFARILTYHQVMPGYLDFVCLFGSQSEPRGLRFSGFREQTLISSPARGPAASTLGRSGRQYQLSYNLKGVTCTNPSVTVATQDKEWSIRQLAVHHQFDVVTGTTLWIMTKGDLEIQKRIKEMTGRDGRPEDKACNTPEECFRCTLRVHLLNSYWAMEEWHSFIQWLEDAIDKKTIMAVYGLRGIKSQQTYTPEDLQRVQIYEEKINQAIMILEANVEVITCLRKYYEGILRNKDFPLKKECRDDVLAFSSQSNDMMFELKMQISRAKLLVRITADRKNLVLSHLQSQATMKMEALTVSMHDIGVLTQREAIAMRIITVVTLIYLPATFVSTFFSTDVIKYQDQPSPAGSYSQTAMSRWLEVTLPLTVLTIGIAALVFRYEDRKRKLKFQEQRDSLGLDSEKFGTLRIV